MPLTHLEFRGSDEPIAVLVEVPEVPVDAPGADAGRECQERENNSRPHCKYRSDNNTFIKEVFFAAMTSFSLQLRDVINED